MKASMGRRAAALSKEDVLSHYRHEEEALGADIPDELLEDEIGCYFPGRCVMPGYHLRGECSEVPRARWKTLTGHDEATTRVFCDFARRAPGAGEEGEK